MWSQGSLEMSTQTELSNILDIFDDQTIDNLTGIANVRANETSDCIFIIDKVNPWMSKSTNLKKNHNGR